MKTLIDKAIAIAVIFSAITAGLIAVGFVFKYAFLTIRFGWGLL